MIMDSQYKPYPIGIENFEKLRNKGCVYVDKTDYINLMIQQGGYYLLCRPRRFGKSLFLSTIEAFFEGKRELFEGLAITKYDYDWEPSPVLHLNLVNVNASDPAKFEEGLGVQFEEWESKYGVTKVPKDSASRFKKIIQTAYERTGKQVVILVDEYDKPLVSYIDDEEMKEKFRNILKPIYSNLKGCDKYIRMGLLTGVSRCSRLSIFSDINNLHDISFSEQYAAICGITEEEMLANFQYGIQQLAETNNLTYDEAVASLKANYDGYHFTEHCPDIYNPFSLLSALQESKVDNYWFATGTPTFLLKAAISEDEALIDFLSTEAPQGTLSQIDAYSDDPVPLMFQTGYLTIKGYDPDLETYMLGVPNREVEHGIFNGLLPLCSHMSARKSANFINKFVSLLRSGRPEDFLEQLQSFLADIPYDLTAKKPEIYFENNLYIIFKMLGFSVQTEYRTSRGRIDILITTPKYIYVIELKLDGSAEDALRQIDEKGYATPFTADSRQLYRIGINLSSSTHTLTDWLIRS